MLSLRKAIKRHGNNTRRVHKAAASRQPTDRENWILITVQPRKIRIAELTIEPGLPFAVLRSVRSDSPEGETASLMKNAQFQEHSDAQRAIASA